jgi:hypothetical protein
LSASDIESFFSGTGYYTYSPQENATPPSTQEPFIEFQSFLKSGRFYYQCSGANSLMTKFFERYFSELGGPFRAETLSGFVVPKLGNLIPLSTGHRITLITQTNTDRKFLRLDATPKRFDKNSPRPAMYPEIPRFKTLFVKPSAIWNHWQKYLRNAFQKESRKCADLF